MTPKTACGYDHPLSNTKHYRYDCNAHIVKCMCASVRGEVPAYIIMHAHMHAQIHMYLENDTCILFAPRLLFYAGGVVALSALRFILFYYGR